MKGTIHSKIRNRYFFAFSLIALLAIGAFINLYYSISSQYIYAELINLSGKQRMLSQRIALFGNRYLTNGEKEAQSILLQTIEMMEKDHQYLLSQTPSETIRAIYHEQPYRLHEKVEQFLKTAKKILVENNHHDFQVLFKSSQELLPLLDHVVKQYQKEVETRNDLIKQLETAILIVILTTLFLEAWYIFKPSVEEMEHQFHKEKAYLDELKHHSISTLIRSIAHQWRQPLQGISLGNAALQDILDENHPDRDKIDPIITTIDKDVAYLSSTIIAIDNLFRHHPNGRMFNLKIKNDDVVLLLESQLRNDNIALSSQMEEFHVFGDPADYVQCLVGLLENASQAITRRREKEPALRGEIQIDGRPTDHHYEIKVIDNGTGIPTELSEHIFEPYSTQHFESRGKGLSLFVIKTIIETRFQGTVFVSNHDDGAIAVLTFPIPQTS